MLEKMMAEIRSGGTFTPATLARRLGTSVEMVQMMLEQLARMGLIVDHASQCATEGSAGACSSCSLGASCHSGAGQGAKLWRAG
jgi:Mn-dependent DtxR family transcriptional regulator